MSEKDDFFVGYLASPASLTRLFKVVFPLLVLVALGIAAWFASGQKSAGQGVWDLSVQKEVSGYLTVDPYPVLHFVGENSKSVILVQQGKKSAAAMSAPFADKWVSVSGYAIDRGDWSMLELTTSSVFKEVVGGASTNIDTTSLGPVSLQGKIIDSKCFLGVMKPGYGKVHRACAAMCLRGGMPPMLVVKNANGEQFGYMLMHKNGESASLDLVDRVVVPVKLSGQLEKRGDMLYVRYEKQTVIPLVANELTEYGDVLASTNQHQ